MSQTATLNGTPYTIPDNGDTNTLAQNVTNWIVAASTTGFIQKSGGTLTGALTSTATGNSLVWDTSTLIVDATNHRVGVGTASPGAVLHTVAADPTFELLRLQKTGGASPGQFGFFVQPIMSGDTTDLQVLPNANASGISFYVRNGSGTSNIGLGIDKNGNVGVGTSAPLSALHVGPGSGALVGTNLQMINNQNGSTGIACHNSSASIETAMFAEAATAGSIGTTTNHNFKIFTNNTLVATFFSSGGVNIGSPTGGDKGAATLNITNDIFKNNSAYTNPDYVLERWVTGKVEKFIGNPGAADYPGLISIDDLETYMRENLDLPRVKSLHLDGGGQGVFGRTDIALEKIEELAIYITQLHGRIKTLEALWTK